MSLREITKEAGPGRRTFTTLVGEAPVAPPKRTSEHRAAGKHQRVTLRLQEARPWSAAEPGIGPYEPAGPHRRFDVAPCSEPAASRPPPYG